MLRVGNLLSEMSGAMQTWLKISWICLNVRLFSLATRFCSYFSNELASRAKDGVSGCQITNQALLFETKLGIKKCVHVQAQITVLNRVNIFASHITETF